jgi:methylated-DNA-[protein]-cysteine S-methyltransferase
MKYKILTSPWGPLMLADAPQGLYQIAFCDGRPAPDGWTSVDSLESGADQQLEEYLRGQRRTFELAYAPRGTDFQRQVWEALDQIPYGVTVSYAEIARRIGRPKAVRAVGAANGANPWPIVRPCHRVIGSNGTLTGYAGGLAFKRGLLAFEGFEALSNPGSGNKKEATNAPLCMRVSYSKL